MRGDGENQLKISAPISLRETYQLTPLSAKQISLDSPFKPLAAAPVGLVHPLE
jgi:hypothetical protein